jgi:tRNA threonylcarbamoyl adenosine modification protein YeaZ
LTLSPVIAVLVSPQLPQSSLAIHTSSPDLGLAVSNLAGDCRSQVWPLGREVSNFLHIHLAEMLPPQTWTDLAFIAVAKGPGGFTGTRLGVVTARTLAQQLQIPLFAISSLAAIAWANRSFCPPDGAIAVQMAAQRGEVFGGLYQVQAEGLVELLPDAVMSLEAWQEILANWKSPCHLIQAEGGLGESVRAVLELAQLGWNQGQRPDWAAALPFYGQHPVDQNVAIQPT